MEESPSQPEHAAPHIQAQAAPLQEAPPVPAVPPEPQTLVAIHVDYDARVNYALQRNDVPIVKLLRIENLDWNDLNDLTVRVTIDTELAQPWERPIARLASFGTFNIDTIALLLDATILAHQAERAVAHLEVEVIAAGKRIGHTRHPIEVLAYNEWAGLASLPENLAAFVMPNHPAIDRVLAAAVEHLRRTTGDPTIDGYQSRDVSRVKSFVEAIYHALCNVGIAYVNPPARFEMEGQKIRSPDQTLEHRMGACLDLSVLAAACFEQAGLHPLIVLVKDHAFVGVWTSDDSFPEPCVDDVLRFSKRIELGEIIALEAVGITTQPAISFEEAEARAAEHLEKKGFHCAIDIRCARKMRIRPLPMRVTKGTFEVVEEGEAKLPQTSAAHQETPHASALTPSLSHPPAAEPEPDEPPNVRLERWKRKLLDLSARNRLINFRESKKSIALLCPDLPALEDSLSTGLAFSIHPRPKLMDESPRDLDSHKQRTGEDALEQYLRDELAVRRLFTSLTENDLQNRLVDIFRAARLSYEESGANTLYLAIGFLEWYESKDKDAQPRRAPILLIPLSMDRKSAREGFTVSLADEEPRINVTLLEKLKVEFGIDTTGLDEAIEDEHGLDVPQIMQRFKKAVRDIDRWQVIDEAHLGLFSFNKFLMWLDLQDRSQALMRSPVVRHLVERGSPALSDAPAFPDPKTLDETHLPLDTYCPLDADSSQLAAVFAAADGHSFVLEGPPGTGKSQTITNLISQCLAAGKRVLFVAEKMAALSVVKKRLERVGLGPFCLELHSNKASKREVLDQLGEALNVSRSASPSGWPRHAEELKASRSELNAFVNELHQVRGSGHSVYQATARLIGLRETPRVRFDPEWVKAMDAAKLQEARERLDQLATAAGAVGDPVLHPYFAVERTEWATTLPEQVMQAGAAIQKASLSLEKSANAAMREMGLAPSPDTGGQGEGRGEGEDERTTEGNDSAEVKRTSPDAGAVTLSRAGLNWLHDFASMLLEPARPTEALLTDPNWPELRKSLLALIARGRQRDAMRKDLFTRYRDTLLALNIEELLAKFRAGQSGFFFTAWLRRRSVQKAVKPFAIQGIPATERFIADLELAIKLRGENQAIASNEQASRAFGSSWNSGEPEWSALEAMIDWADRFRALRMKAGARDFDPASLRARVIALCVAERDYCAPEAPVGKSLAGLKSAMADLVQSRKSITTLLKLNEERAWGTEQAHEFLPRLRQTVQRLSDHTRSLPDWCYWRRTRDAVAVAGLEPLLLAYETGEIRGVPFAQVFERSFQQQWLSDVTDATPMLRQFNSREQERRIARFSKLDQDGLNLVTLSLRAKLGEQVPRAAGQASDSSEVGILQRQLKLQRRHMPLRKLIQRLPNLLPRLKPCLLMSPLSVAQYLDAEFPPFDVIVFDEASQIPVWDAVGAIARGRQVIIVGDSKQLPPTTFFMKADNEDDVPDEDDFEELESVLDECTASGLPSMYLLWHYRSRHESLIAFSNYHYYGNRLQTFPSPQERSATQGVSLRYIDSAVYDRGNTRTNRAEAEAIVSEIVARLIAVSEREDAIAAKSIGVVTFSIPQQALIEDMLDAERRKHPEIDVFFGDTVPEPVFVKNLENVQGDERDIILFSVCYGPDKDGRVSMGFGPLNRPGGERRLNVAITRAREQVILFSPLRADQIDLARTQSVAVKHLKGFLDYAERGPGAIAEAVTLKKRDALDDAFEKAIAAQLIERGWQVETHVGCSSFRIDLAVKDPDHADEYLIGILCDGPFYAAAATARDRDRSRAGVLEHLGWRLHRVWSSDWWLDPQRELGRIEEALGAAKKAVMAREAEAAAAREAGASAKAQAEDGDAKAEVIASPLALAVEALAQARMEIEEVDEPDAPPGMSVYMPVLCDKPRGEPEAFYESKSRRAVRDLVLRVVKREGPIQMEMLVKRVIAFWGFTRITSRAQGHVEEIIAVLPPTERPKVEGGIVWSVTQDVATYDGWRVPGDDGESRRAEEIPAIEYANAARNVLEQQIGLPMVDLVRETAKVFGFSRMTSKVQPAVEAGIALLVERGGCVQQGGVVTLPRE
ncbi:MAG: DUF3320 domain-containing protein [Phycisphaeraceae bacterium]